MIYAHSLSILTDDATHQPKLSAWYRRVVAALPEFEPVHNVLNKVATKALQSPNPVLLTLTNNAKL